MLCRHSREYGLDALRQQLSDWESWAAELLESHLSYPVLALFRSQHYNQSWLAALTVILDTCALVMTCVEWSGAGQAKLTFAMARHTVVDLSLAFGLSLPESSRDRLSLDGMAELRARLADAGLKFRSGDEIDRNLAERRRTYEPYVNTLSQFLCITVPPFVAAAGRHDDWETSTRGPDRKRLHEAAISGGNEDEHF